MIPTPGYWIECSRQKITNETLWDDTESDGDDQDDDEDPGEGPSRGRYPRDDSLLLEDDEYFEEEEEEPPPRLELLFLKYVAYFRSVVSKRRRKHKRMGMKSYHRLPKFLYESIFRFELNAKYDTRG